MNELTFDRFRRICFVRTGGPGDEPAFERSLRLCQRSGAELSIVGVVDDPPSGIVHLLEKWGFSSELVDNEQEESAQTSRLAEMAGRRRITAHADVLHGTAALEILRKVQAESCDLLVKAAQPTSILGHLLFGYTDRQLVRKCPCPTWIENPSARGRHNRILAAVDPAPFRDDPGFDAVREELNVSVLESAALLAELEGAELHVVHVWHCHFEGMLQNRADFAAADVTKITDSFKQKHEQALARLVGPYLPLIARVHLLKGDAADELCRLAASEAFDVVVMGTVCRTGVAGWLIGNTAETVLNQVECSLAAIKPPGFVCPVGVAP